MLRNITTREEFSAATKEGTVVVDFFASWCGPCKMLTPVLEQLAEEKKDVVFLKVDVDQASALAAQFQVQAVPTILLFKDGKLVDNRMGYQNKNQLLNFINQ
ncbi:MAG: thioredoxin [Erysipelotrichia bacterium]|nr:thioredoxin [Erysipelotrichia bacterium]